MATPPREAWDQALNDYAGRTIQSYIRSKYPPSALGLDVGAGWAKYKLLLPEYTMDAVEIWEPYVKQHQLEKQYRKVFITNVLDFEPQENYAFVIFGDTLEHLTPADARKAVEKFQVHGCAVIAAVPYEMYQDVWEGNPYEEHKQNDLTASLMQERIPSMRLLADDRGQYGHTKAVWIG